MGFGQILIFAVVDVLMTSPLRDVAKIGVNSYEKGSFDCATEEIENELFLDRQER